MFFIVAIITLLILLISSCGYGFAIQKRLAGNVPSYFSYAAAIGIACLAVIGGVMNAASIAYPAAMYVVLLVGLLLFIVKGDIKSRMSHISTRAFIFPFPGTAAVAIGRSLPYCLVASVTVFFAVSLLPSAVMNLHDDFHTYLSRPLRMLQTGLLLGGPFDLLGMDSLGAHAFLQGFILLYLPVEYLPGLDVVLGFGMAGLLLVAAAHRLRVGWTHSTLAILIFATINPQSVNVSTLYLGVFVILGLLFTGGLLLERVNELVNAKLLGLASLSGVFVAALVAMKVTIAAYAVIYFLLYGLGLLLIARNKKACLLLYGAACLGGLLALIPWVLLQSSHYAAALNAVRFAGAPAEGVAWSGGNISDLFSLHNSVYGVPIWGYGGVVIFLALLGAALVSCSLYYKLPDTSHGRHAINAACACAAAVVTYLINGLLFDPPTAVRYACPPIIATVPFALLAAHQNAGGNSPFLKAAWVRKGSLIGVVLILIFFGGSFIDRLQRAYYQHTSVSFAINDRDLQYNREVFSSKAKQSIRDIQYRTVAGEKILAWVSTPFLFDFKRNEIFTVEDAGLAAPWLDMPLNGAPADMVRYFRRLGIRYILWEYQGFGMRKQKEMQRMLSFRFPVYQKIGKRSLHLGNSLSSIMEKVDFLYYDKGVVLFDLNQVEETLNR